MLGPRRRKKHQWIGDETIDEHRTARLCRGGSGAGSLGGAQQLTGGGGIVAEIVRDLQKPSRFSGGGSSRNFSRDIHESISQ